VKNVRNTFRRFHRVRERDIETDRQTATARWHRPRLCTASRGKNRLYATETAI